MQKRRLGSDGPEISVIGYGTWGAGGMAWGPQPPDEQIIEAIRAGVDAGINWIDTAEVYGGGRSERLVGAAVADRPEVMVFTKLAPRRAGSGFDPDGVRRGVEGSLQRLGRDVIDLYQLHWPDRSIPVETTWEAMAQLVEEGLVRHIGLSNFSREEIERCERIRHVDSLQPHFSLLHRDGREDLFPFCESNGTGIIAYGPLAYGILTGAFTKETRFGPDDWRGGGHGVSYYDELFAPGRFERNIDIADQLKKVAERLGITLPQLALAWVFHQRGVTAAIAGSRSVEHTLDNAGAGDVRLSPEVLEEIEAIVTGG